MVVSSRRCGSDGCKLTLWTTVLGVPRDSRGEPSSPSHTLWACLPKFTSRCLTYLHRRSGVTYLPVVALSSAVSADSAVSAAVTQPPTLAHELPTLQPSRPVRSRLQRMIMPINVCISMSAVVWPFMDGHYFSVFSVLLRTLAAPGPSLHFLPAYLKMFKAECTWP